MRRVENITELINAHSNFLTRELSVVMKAWEYCSEKEVKIIAEEPN